MIYLRWSTIRHVKIQLKLNPLTMLIFLVKEEETSSKPDIDDIENVICHENATIFGKL